MAEVVLQALNSSKQTECATFLAWILFWYFRRWIQLILHNIVDFHYFFVLGHQIANFLFLLENIVPFPAKLFPISIKRRAVIAGLPERMCSCAAAGIRVLLETFFWSRWLLYTYFNPRVPWRICGGNGADGGSGWLWRWMVMIIASSGRATAPSSSSSSHSRCVMTWGRRTIYT